MPLLQKPKKVEQVVALLRDPDPVFVSIVDHAATQTPFQAVKRASKESTMAGIRRNITGAKEIATDKKAARKVGVHKLTFEGDAYGSLAAVEKFLADNGWEGYTIAVKAGGGFEATGDADDKDYAGMLREIPVVDGVTATVGELTAEAAAAREAAAEPSAEPSAEPGTAEEVTAAAAAAAAGSEDAADDGDDEESETDAADQITQNGKKVKVRPGVRGKPAADDGQYRAKSELATKFDMWYAMFSKDTDLKGVMADGMKDGLPPGVLEIVNAMVTATANTFLSADDTAAKKASVQQIGSDYATMVTGLYELFSAYAGESSAQKAADTAAARQAKTQFAGDFAAFLTEHGDKAAKAADPLAGTSADALAGALSDALTKAFGGLTTTLAEQIGLLSTKIDKVTEAATAAKVLAEHSAATVDEIASAAPLKKAAPADVLAMAETTLRDPDADTRKAAESEAEQRWNQRVFRNSIGL